MITTSDDFRWWKHGARPSSAMAKSAAMALAPRHHDLGVDALQGVWLSLRRAKLGSYFLHVQVTQSCQMIPYLLRFVHSSGMKRRTSQPPVANYAVAKAVGRRVPAEMTSNRYPEKYSEEVTFQSETINHFWRWNEAKHPMDDPNDFFWFCRDYWDFHIAPDSVELFGSNDHYQTARNFGEAARSNDLASKGAPTYGDLAMDYPKAILSKTMISNSERGL